MRWQFAANVGFRTIQVSTWSGMDVVATPHLPLARPVRGWQPGLTAGSIQFGSRLNGS